MALVDICKQLFFAGLTVGTLSMEQSHCSEADLGSVSPQQGQFENVGLKVSQVDGLGGLDIITADSNGNFSIYYNDGSGNFTRRTKIDFSNILGGLKQFEIGQYDGEGLLDMIAYTDEGFFYLFRDNRTGSFRPNNKPLNNVPFKDIVRFELQQMDGIGGYDIVFMTKDGLLYTMANDGSGNFSQSRVKNQNNPIPISGNASILDFRVSNLDSYRGNDVLVGLTNGEFYLMLDDGNGNYHAPRLINQGHQVAGLKQFEVEQMNGLGGYDIVCANEEGEFYLMINLGEGKFSVPKSRNPNHLFPNIHSFGIKQMDGKEGYDIMIYQNDGSIFLMANNGDGNFYFPKLRNPNNLFPNLNLINISQIDGIEGYDLIIHQTNGNITLMRNNGNGNFYFPNNIQQ